MSTALLIDLSSKENVFLSADDLVMLSSALVVGTSSLPNMENILHRFSLTFEDSSFPNVAPVLFLSLIHLIVRSKDQYVAQILDLLERNSKHVDHLVMEVSALFTEHNSPSVALNDSVDALCNCLILLSVLLSSSDFTAETVLCFLDYNIYATISLLLHAFAKVSGARAGCAPLFMPFYSCSGSSEKKQKIQIEVLSKIVSVVRQLTSWRIHDFLERKKLRFAHYKKSPILSFTKSSASFRNYLTMAGKRIFGSTFLTELSVYFIMMKEKYYTVDFNSYQRMIKDVAALLDNLLILSGHCQNQFRRCILHSDLVGALFVPFLCFQAVQTNVDFSKFSSALSVIARSLATFAFHLKGIQEVITKKENSLVNLCAAIPEKVLHSSTAEESNIDTAQHISLLIHLTRIMLNANLSSFLPILGKKWNSFDKKGKEVLFARLLFEGEHQLAPVEKCGKLYEAFVALLQIKPEDIANDEKVFEVANITKASRARRRNRYARLKQKGKQRSSNNFTFDIPLPSLRREKKKEPLLQSSEVDEEKEKEKEKEEVMVVEPEVDDTDTDDACLDFLADSSTHSDEKEEITPEIDLSEWRKGPPPARIPLDYICALSHRFIQSVAVLSPEGYVFDYLTVKDYLKTSEKCPISGKPLKLEDLIVDEAINKRLQELREDFLNA